EEFNRPPHSPAPISVQAVPGTPFCVTVDFDTRGEKGPELLDTVTLRHRDDDSQERVKISDLLGKLLPLVS
ncbi:MAG: His/Gly/Thr/Pro-type tRNA ligase C-terminal domain-containing protein, partial [Verrucomicrobiota bacterium]